MNRIVNLALFVFSHLSSPSLILVAGSRAGNVRNRHWNLCGVVEWRKHSSHQSIRPTMDSLLQG